jgi:hypothetical protein
MNAVMERWVRTCRREMPDRTLIWHQRHLLRRGQHGYVRTSGRGTVTMRVRVPGGWGPQLTLRTGGQTRRLTAQAGYAQWTMNVTSGQAKPWSLT